MIRNWVVSNVCRRAGEYSMQPFRHIVRMPDPRLPSQRSSYGFARIAVTLEDLHGRNTSVALWRISITQDRTAAAGIRLPRPKLVERTRQGNRSEVCPDVGKIRKSTPVDGAIPRMLRHRKDRSRF
jgi:hypothetical protein